ncbi:DUF6798 domain-containing protein [Fuerstiella marisgermanici]|uniref:DUF6798 domain-containing protein n=1 Tax=Fuerstiella marisgermanici TaxID=1891926 RepID=A0A1P8WFC5_9PLAN|nr:DUF6798 domain-containing protein [Fuerstiella marisgermanici]APZ92727.1 hypothetical protein Fuma_02339 [Fuerstiella marisgermanici]
MQPRDEPAAQILASPGRLGDSRWNAVAAWAVVSGIFVAVSLWQTPLPGINEPHYLTKARAFADPGWCERDFFLQSANAHYVFFAVVGPVTTWFCFGTVAVIGRILSLSLLACGWNMIGRRLGLNALGSAVAASVFCGIGATGNFSGEWIIGGFEGKVPSYGFALVGVAWWLDAWTTSLRRKYALAGVFMGAAVAWHPVVGMWICIGIAISEFARLVSRVVLRSKLSDEHVADTSDAQPDIGRTATTSHLLVNSIVFVLSAFVVALPGLIPAAELVLSSTLEADPVDQANYIQVFWRLAHHLDPSTFPPSAWLHTAVLLTVCLAAIVFVRTKSIADRWYPLLWLLAASSVVCAAGIGIGWHSKPMLQLPDWQWRAALLKFYPFRFFDALLPITASFAVAAAWDKLRLMKLKQVTARSVLAAALMALSAAVIIVPGRQHHASYTPAAFAEWQRACEWLRQNTSADALVLGPRESFGLKWFAHRAEYVCFKDCPQDAAGILEWNRRLWAIHGWSESSYQDESFDVEDTQRLHADTGITHIITRRLGPFTQPPVSTFGMWRVYAIAGGE